jgi:flagellar motor component MotA
LEAGYSESQANSARPVIESEGVQEGLSDTVETMKKIRDNGLKALEDKKLSEEKAKDIADIVDKIQKNIQLLTGGDTERVKFNTILVKYLNEKSTDSGE